MRHWGLRGFLQVRKTNYFTDGCYLLQIKLSFPSEQWFGIKESQPTLFLPSVQLFTNPHFHGLTSVLYSTVCTHMILVGTGTQFFWSEEHRPSGFQQHKTRPYSSLHSKKTLTCSFLEQHSKLHSATASPLHYISRSTPSLKNLGFLFLIWVRSFSYRPWHL